MVLVVDDDADLRLALRHGLRGAGFEVHEAHDAAAAYTAAVAVRPDIVLLDWVMPGEDAGAVACAKLCDLHPDGEVVMFTGLSDVRDQRAAFEAGATAFLVKGIQLEQLAGELRRVLPTGRFSRVQPPVSGRPAQGRPEACTRRSGASAAEPTAPAPRTASSVVGAPSPSPPRRTPSRSAPGPSPS